MDHHGIICAHVILCLGCLLCLSTFSLASWSALLCHWHPWISSTAALQWSHCDQGLDHWHRSLNSSQWMTLNIVHTHGLDYLRLFTWMNNICTADIVFTCVDRCILIMDMMDIDLLPLASSCFTAVPWLSSRGSRHRSFRRVGTESSVGRMRWLRGTLQGWQKDSTDVFTNPLTLPKNCSPGQKQETWRARAGAGGSLERKPCPSSSTVSLQSLVVAADLVIKSQHDKEKRMWAGVFQTQ